MAGMISLPQPDDLTSLVLRANFSDDVAWDVLQAAIDSSSGYHNATYVSDPTYAGMTVQELVDADAATSDDDRLTYIFVADAITMIDDEHPLLAVDLYSQPGRTFRVPPHWYADVSANLTIANMDFAEFADATDGSGTFRGFDGERPGAGHVRSSRCRWTGSGRPPLASMTAAQPPRPAARRCPRSGPGPGPPRRPGPPAAAQGRQRRP